MAIDERSRKGGEAHGVPSGTYDGLSILTKMLTAFGGLASFLFFKTNDGYRFRGIEQRRGIHG